MRGLLIFTFAAASLAAAAVHAEEKKIQCWTDHQGRRSCGDRVPPEFAGQKREVIKEGRVVETTKQALTEEERAIEQRRAAEAVAAQKRAEYDRSLIQTYRTSRDLEAMRDERLSFIDGRLNAAKKSLADNEKSLSDLRARAEQQQKDKGKVDDRLTKQIAQFERSLAGNQKSIANMEREREQTKSQFDTDIARFRELRGEPAPAPAPEAAPAAAPAPAAPPPAKTSG